MEYNLFRHKYCSQDLVENPVYTLGPLYTAEVAQAKILIITARAPSHIVYPVAHLVIESNIKKNYIKSIF